MAASSLCMHPGRMGEWLWKGGGKWLCVKANGDGSVGGGGGGAVGKRKCLPYMKRGSPGRRGGRRWVGKSGEAVGGRRGERGSETVMVADRLEFTTGSW